jgi:hypothetical protein
MYSCLTTGGLGLLSNTYYMLVERNCMEAAYVKFYNDGDALRL